MLALPGDKRIIVEIYENTSTSKCEIATLQLQERQDAMLVLEKPQLIGLDYEKTKMWLIAEPTYLRQCLWSLPSVAHTTENPVRTDFTSLPSPPWRIIDEGSLRNFFPSFCPCQSAVKSQQLLWGI